MRCRGMACNSRPVVFSDLRLGDIKPIRYVGSGYWEGILNPCIAAFGHVSTVANGGSSG